MKFKAVKYILLSFSTLIASPLLFSRMSLAQSEDAIFKQVNVYRTVNEEGYSQIVSESEGIIKAVTDDKWPHADPVTNNKIIVWAAQVGSLWQLYYYDVLSEQTVQLTREGNNVNPQLSGDILVWEGQRGGVWYILMFDGVRIARLSVGEYPAQKPVIKDGYIAYEQKNSLDEWQIYLFDMQLERTIDLTPLSTGRSPDIQDGLVTWQAADGESGEITYFTYETGSQDTFYEGVKEGRRKIGELLFEKPVKEVIKKLPKPGFKPYVPPSQDEDEVEEVTVEDIMEELGLDFEELAPDEESETIEPELVEDTDVIESTESVEESTSSAP